MHNATLVRRRQPSSRLQCVIDTLANRDWSLLDSLAHALALQQLGDEIGNASSARAEAIDRHNIGMVKSGRSPCFLLESPHSLRVRGQLLWQNLQRHFTTKAVVARAIDLAHAPRTQQRQDFAI